MTDREHVHHFEWDADGWRCACGYWIEQVGSDIEDVLNEWARQKVCMRELEAQVAALTKQLRYTQGAILDVQCRMEMGETDAKMLSPILRKLHRWLAPDVADADREWLADAQAVAKAGHELLCWATCHHLVNWKAAPWEALHAALSRAHANGWLEP